MTNESPALAPRSQFLIISAFALSIFFVRFDGFIVNLAMPTFVKVFGISISQASWVALAYILMQVSAVMLFGKLCDRMELKSIFVWGIAVFTLGSFLCGLPVDFWFLIAFRCLQGIGGSMMLVSAYAAVAVYLPRERIGWGLGIMTTAAALGVFLGPIAGGCIINYWDWHWLFLINVPVGLLALIYCRRVIPLANRQKPSTENRLDYAGAFHSSLALLLLIFALNMGQELGWRSWTIRGCFALSTVFFLIFYFTEKKCPWPLLDMNLFSNRAFIPVVIGILAGFIMFYGGNFLIPFYLTQQGLPPHSIGLLLGIFALVYIPVGLYAGRLSDRYSPRRLVCAAMFFAGLTGFAFALTSRSGGTWPAVLYLVMNALSYGFFFSPVNHLIMNFAGEKNKGSVSAIYNTSMVISMALGVVLMETVYSEFTVPTKGFTAAFCGGGASCFLALLLLWQAKSNGQKH